MFIPYAGKTTPCNRHHAVSLLFANDPHLMDFFFSEERLFSRWDHHHGAASLADSEMDVGESVLVQLALNLCLENGQIRLHEVYRHLSAVRFHCLIMALELMFAAGGCSCTNCRHRFSPVPSSWTANHQSFLGVTERPIHLQLFKVSQVEGGRDQPIYVS